MDIVTHAMMGTIVASPFLQSQPEAAAAFMFGSVVPDLDAFSRVFGRRAFLESHQTYSHAYPVIAMIGLAALGLREALDVFAPWAPLAFALGMAFHTTLDWTNTYGITLFAPFTRKRFCREWVFFIDSVVLVACGVALTAIGLSMSRGEAPSMLPAAAFSVSMLLYWILKVFLRRRAMAASPQGTLSLLPSALIPWEYLGCARQGEEIVTFCVSALSGARYGEETYPILDADHASVLDGLAEVQAMRALSPAYHLVEAKPGAQGTSLVCRDLRTRNFGAKFGQLNVEVDAGGKVQGLVFHV